MRQRQSLAPVILTMLGLNLLACVWWSARSAGSTFLGVTLTVSEQLGFDLLVELPLLFASVLGGLVVVLVLGERMRNHRVLLTVAACVVGVAAAYGMAILMLHTMAGGSVSGAGAGVHVLPAAASGLGRALVDDHR